eukprot:2699524-Rhodomonas_salina.1
MVSAIVERTSPSAGAMLEGTSPSVWARCSNLRCTANRVLQAGSPLPAWNLAIGYRQHLFRVRSNPQAFRVEHSASMVFVCHTCACRGCMQNTHRSRPLSTCMACPPFHIACM